MIRDSSYYVDYQRYQIDAEQNNSILQKTFYSRYFEYMLIDKYSQNIWCTYWWTTEKSDWEFFWYTHVDAKSVLELLFPATKNNHFLTSSFQNGLVRLRSTIEVYKWSNS